MCGQNPRIVSQAKASAASHRRRSLSSSRLICSVEYSHFRKLPAILDTSPKEDAVSPYQDLKGYGYILENLDCVRGEPNHARP